MLFRSLPLPMKAHLKIWGRLTVFDKYSKSTDRPVEIAVGENGLPQQSDRNAEQSADDW